MFINLKIIHSFIWCIDFKSTWVLLVVLQVCYINSWVFFQVESLRVALSFWQVYSKQTISVSDITWVSHNKLWVAGSDFIMWEPQGIDIQSSFFSTHTNTTHSNSTKVLFDRKLTIKWWSCVFSRVGIPSYYLCSYFSSYSGIHLMRT